MTMASSRCTLPTLTQKPLSLDLLQCPSGMRTRSESKACRTPPISRRSGENWELLEGLTLVGPYGIPKLEACHSVPDRLVAFSETSVFSGSTEGTWVHFYEDDLKFRCLWNQPEKYLDRFRSFAGIIGPDYSVYENMPRVVQAHNTYRNQLLSAWAQKQGVPVIPNVRLSGLASVPYALAGVPENSAIALGLHGCIKNRKNRRKVIAEMHIICAHLQPRSVLIYGSAAYGVADIVRERDIPVHVYPPDTWTRSKERRAQ